jgi:DNA-binding beta-propeller fold protein YncE
MSLRINTIKGVRVRATGQRGTRMFVPIARSLRGSVGSRLHVSSAGLLRAGGSAAPWRALLAIPLATLCALLALSAGIARAEPPKLVSYGQFSAHEHAAVGVAVEGSGDLFVSGFLNFDDITPESVVKFDPSGKLLSPPSPFGSAYYSGVAVNPTNGDVYVLGEESLFAPTMIFVYDPNTGAPVGTPFEVPASRNWAGGFATDLQIAADSAGNVYVPVVPKNEVLEYSPSGTLLKTFTGSGQAALKEPNGVAVDSSGDVWVGDTGNNRIEELSPTGTFIMEIQSEGAHSVALDGHGDVLAVVQNNADPCGERSSPCTHLVEYSSEGRQLADVGAGSFALEPLYSMVAVDQASGRVYVTDGGAGIVWVFGPPVAPVVDRELTAEVGVSEAKLGALVNPGGIQTSYRFEYDTREYKEGEAPHGQSTPFPEGSVGEGVQLHAVWASASGLAPGRTYHYRVVASNELAPGGIAGPDQTFTTLSAEQAACPNEQMRGGFSGRLPDCRAYELVTPPVTTSAQFDANLREAYGSRAAADGEALTLHIQEPRPGAPTAGEEYVARRGAGGWIAEDIMPLESYDGLACSQFQGVNAYSQQLTRDVMMAGGGSSSSYTGHIPYGENPESCNPEGRQVVSGEPVGYENLLVRDNATGTYQLVNVPPSGVTPSNAFFQAASADSSHVIFTETSPLAAGASYGVENLYEWDEGALRLVSRLPDGTAVTGSLAARAAEFEIGERKLFEHEGALSSDGSHVLFTYGGALYDRIGGQRTVQIDASQTSPAGPGGGGSFKTATSDGSKVFFLDESKLTAGSTAESGNPDLYECVLPAGASRCELTDLTLAKAGEHANVLRVTPLGGHDSSFVYFTATGVLASNTREFTNSEGKTVVEGAQAGQENLYLWNGEKTTFIASGVEYSRLGIEQASHDGKWLAFESRKSLTGYNNTPAGGICDQQVAGCPELFLYSAVTAQLACASCNPTGEPAIGGSNFEITGGGVARRDLANGEVFGLFPTRHVLTDAGQVFFETTEALVPSDTNGGRDVYEFQGASAHLISSGTSSFESNLEDVSESGNDVFFRSTQQLVPQDNQEGLIVTYDARVDGGFAEQSSPPSCTTADACRTPVSPQPSIYGAPASQTFSGVGNLVSPPPTVVKKVTKKTVKCKKGFVKNKRGKCVRQKSKKQAKRASHNRRGK